MSARDTSFLSCLKKRDLLNDETADGTRLIREGERFLEQGLLMDALNLFRKASQAEGLKAILDRAVDEGDTFICASAASALGIDVSNETWSKTGQAALDAGKLMFALKAFKNASDEEMVEKVSERIRDNGLGI